MGLAPYLKPPQEELGVEAVLNDSGLILSFSRNIQGSLGLDVYEISAEEGMAAAMLMDEIKLDFDDTIQYYLI